MNEQLESTGQVESRPEQMNGRSTHTGLADDTLSPALPPMFQHSARQRADLVRVRPSSLRGRELGTGNRLHSSFLAVLSHEMRNSLGVIRSATHIQRLEASASPVTAKARLLIERQVEQMSRLVDDLLDVSLVRSGHLSLRCERIDLCAVVAQAAQTVEFTMQQRKHRMSTALPSAPLWLQADPARLEQIFVNLLLNAAKYTESGGRIALSVEHQEGEATVRVRDTGIGMTSDVLLHVFDLFVQANPSSRSADAGLGIGLALVRSLVECHGGRVTAVSAGLRQGSEFTVCLPMPAR
jgi:signal transduction histidine kinase